MPIERAERALAAHLDELRTKGTAKGAEQVFVEVLPAAGARGPRFHLAGEGDKEFLRLNSNSYLGLSFHPALLAAEEEATRRYGVGPGAVRFISGTYQPHIELEAALAAFHGREAGMIFSAAWVSVLGVLVPLLTAETAVVSDELNHNCIIQAIRLARPREKHIYRHLDMGELAARLEEAARECRRAVVVTDGIFSMRGDHAPLDEIAAVCRRYDDRFAENVILLVDDSHGVGACGATGRGVEELTGSPPADVLVATLGKALGVNGGYLVGSRTLIEFVRETAPTYIYSNPITAGEAAAARCALAILDSDEGRRLLDHLRRLTERFRGGLGKLGYETLAGEHPVVPLMVRDTAKTSALVAHLRHHGILATGLNYPVVPKGDEEIRFQLNASHTRDDIDRCLEVLGGFGGR